MEDDSRSERSLSDEPSSPVPIPGARTSSEAPSLSTSPITSSALGQELADGSSFRNKSFSEPVPDSSKSSKKKEYKHKRKQYLAEKKRLEKEFFDDRAKPLFSGVLKIRNTVKNWHKFYCVLRPGLLDYFKESNHSDWAGTILLSDCQVVERPSKKDGFCFKLFNPHKKPIHAEKGPRGETWFNAHIMPVEYSILRAPSEGEGKGWLSAIRTACQESRSQQSQGTGSLKRRNSYSLDDVPGATMQTHDPHSFVRRHSTGALSDDGSSTGNGKPVMVVVDEESDLDGASDDSIDDADILDDGWSACPPLTRPNVQVNKDIQASLWAQLHTVPRGGSLDNAPWPASLLQPRTLLPRLADPLAHAYLLKEAACKDTPESRMLGVTSWVCAALQMHLEDYALSLPLMPLQGEVFRCVFQGEPTSGTQQHAFFISEQVAETSTAVYASDRRHGWTLQGSFASACRFYGNVLTATPDGILQVDLLKAGESYSIRFPDACVRGLTMLPARPGWEGKAIVFCPQTSLTCTLFLETHEGGNVHGSLETSTRMLGSIVGQLNTRVEFKPNSEDDESLTVFDFPSEHPKRMTRYCVEPEEQHSFSDSGFFDSQRVWQHATKALVAGDYEVAQDLIKTIRERASNLREPVLFEAGEHFWLYRHRNQTCWSADEGVECMDGGIIRTRRGSTRSKNRDSGQRESLLRPKAQSSPKRTMSGGSTPTVQTADGKELKRQLNSLQLAQEEHTATLLGIQQELRKISGMLAEAKERENAPKPQRPLLSTTHLIIIVSALLAQVLIGWLF